MSETLIPEDELSPEVSTRERLVLASSLESQRSSDADPIIQTHGERIAGLTKAVQARLKIKEISGDKSELSEEDTAKLKSEVEAKEAAETHNGVDFSRVQIGQILKWRATDHPIDFETFSPYMADYDLVHGTIPEDILLPEDAIGLRLASTFRRLFPQGRLVSLYDEYNTAMPDTAEVSGQPVQSSETAQLALPPEVKEAFKQNIVGLLKNHGAISQEGKEGEEFLMISESSKAEDAEEFVGRLEAKGFIQRDGDEVFFVNPDAENPLYQKIILRSKAGRWYCEALDASSYLKPENLEITHIVVLPDYMKEQQDKVWEMLRVLGIRPNNYHNMFYDKNRDPEAVASTIAAEFAKFDQTHTEAA